MQFLTNYLIEFSLDYFFLILTDSFHSIFYDIDFKNFVFNLSGFSGSACVILFGKDKKYIFVDGRYFLQAKNEVFNDFCVLEVSNIFNFEFIFKIISDNFFSSTNDKNKKSKNYNFNEKLKIGIHEKNISYKIYSLLTDFSHILEIQFIDLCLNAWMIPKKKQKIIEYKKEFSGEETFEKLNKFSNAIKMEILKHEIKENFAYIMTNEESISYLLNLRNLNKEFNLSVNGALIITSNDIHIFSDEDFNLNKSYVTMHSISNFFEKLSEIYINKHYILHDENIPFFILKEILKIPSKVKTNRNELFLKILMIQDPSFMLRSIKNNIEIFNAKKIHLIESIAFIKTIFTVQKMFRENIIFSELNVVEILENNRKKFPSYITKSFETIVAFGKNSAIVHYSPKKSSELKSDFYLDYKEEELHKKNLIMLIDAGGQYYGGTTDATRTVWLMDDNFSGDEFFLPTEKAKRYYTTVLMSHIDLSSLIFPLNSSTAQLDGITRKRIWDEGSFLNYDHGTGHGVGNCLNVHESPFSISPFSKNKMRNNVILSNEPGIYEPNYAGFRIENLIYSKSNEKNLNWLNFENLTMIPMSFELTNFSLLPFAHKNWLKNYHSQILKNFEENNLNLKEDEEVYDWLKTLCHKFMNS